MALREATVADIMREASPVVSMPATKKMPTCRACALSTGRGIVDPLADYSACELALNWAAFGCQLQ